MDITPLTTGMAVKKPRASDALADEKKDAGAHKAAEAFEANFLGEMLKESGINKVSDSFGGGEGEAFSSFLTQEYATKLAHSGGFGLAEQIFEAIKQRGSGA